jgi:hypothetical protein
VETPVYKDFYVWLVKHMQTGTRPVAAGQEGAAN